MTFSCILLQISHIPAKTDLRHIQKATPKSPSKAFQKAHAKSPLRFLASASLPFLILRNHIEDFLGVLGVLACHVFDFVLGVAGDDVPVVFHALSK